MIASVLVALTVAAFATARAASKSNATRARIAPTPAPSRALHPALGLIRGRVLERRRARDVETALPDGLDAIARSLRSGASLVQAINDASRAVRGRLAEDLAIVACDVERGRQIAEALGAWADRSASRGVRLATTALAIGAETGGASAQAVDGVAATLRTNLAIAGEVRALSSQARLSALVIALAPLAFTGLAVTSDPRTAAFLFASPAGLACLAAGLALDALGWWWMRSITATVA